MSSTDPTSFEDRFASLEASNVLLAENVQALTTTLEVVNELQREQRAMRDRNTRTAARVEEVQEESSARLERARHTASVTAAALGILLPVVSIIVYLSLLQHVNALLNEGSSDRYYACQTRNATNEANRVRELALAEADKDPAVKKIHRDSAVAIAAGNLDCAKLYPRAVKR